MRALAIVHQPDAGPGVFAEAALECGWSFQTWSIAEGGASPGDPSSFDAVLTFGGAAHADQEERHRWLAGEKQLLARLLEDNVPLLGVCLGAQLLAEAAGAPALRASEPEIGWYPVRVTDAGALDPLLRPLAPEFTAFQWHSYECSLPPGAVALAESPLCLQAFRIREHAWGIQFHAEVSVEDARRWIADYRSDEDAVRVGIDPGALSAATDRAMAGWNVLGRGICSRFLGSVAKPR
jgi:GMP synthase (glutamine-hydrolysing)